MQELLPAQLWSACLSMVWKALNGRVECEKLINLSQMWERVPVVGSGGVGIVMILGVVAGVVVLGGEGGQVWSGGEKISWL